MSPEQAIVLVQQFFAALERCDVEAMAAQLTDDAIYHDMPRQRFAGREAIAAFWRTDLAPLTDVRVEVRHVVAQGDVVLSERVDRFVVQGRSVSIPAMSTFELRDGKIAALRDYWDVRTAERQLRAAAPSATE